MDGERKPRACRVPRAAEPTGFATSTIGDLDYAFIAEFADVTTRVRTLAYWFRDHFHPNVEYQLAGTPCEDVVNGSLCHHPVEVGERIRDRHPVPGSRLSARQPCARDWSSWWQ
jgi:hypothetical protein